MLNSNTGQLRLDEEGAMGRGLCHGKSLLGVDGGAIQGLEGPSPKRVGGEAGPGLPCLSLPTCSRVTGT